MQKHQSKNIKELVLESVNELVDFVKTTYGPAENKVLIHKTYHSQIVDDGVAIVREHISEDPARNAIISIIKEVASKTNDRVGDGTTSSLIILQAIIQEISKSNLSPREIVEELKNGVKEVKDQLQKSAKKVSTYLELCKIARISFNNEAIANIIAKLIFDLGHNAVITTEDSNTGETSSEQVEGLEIDNGFVSPYMINTDKQSCELEKPFILITDHNLTAGADILPIMEKIHTSGRKELVIIADKIEGDALATLIQNNSTIMNPATKQVGALKILAVHIPLNDRTDFVKDLCLLTGAEPITVEKGFTDWSKVELKHLGRCDKIVAKKDKTIILGSKGNKEEIKKVIKSLQEQLKITTNSYEKERIEKRLSKFTNGIAVIKAGSPTENELKALKFKIEDTINAVKSAYKNGVVCGAGLSLARLDTTSPILNKALKYPFNQLKENSELEISLHEFKENEAIDAITGKKGNYLELGIIDPVEVLIAGCESAVSIACLLTTLKGISYEVPDEKK